MWPETIRVIREVRPHYALCENVPGLISGDHGYFGRILNDLSQSGYDARWRIISAADVGASHLRKRLWILAHSRRGNQQQCGESMLEAVEGGDSRSRRTPNSSKAGGSSCEVGDVSDNASLRRQEIGKQLGLDMVVVIEDRKEDSAKKGQLNPDWVEWLMGFPRSWTGLEQLEEVVWTGWEIDPADIGECPRVTSGTPNRVNRLKALGNAQVPSVVVKAWELLSKEAENG